MISFPESYLIFLGGLGWMLVAWSAVPEVIGRRAVWWLIAFALTMAFGEAMRATLVQLDGDPVASVESTLGLCWRLALIAILLEFLRRFTWPDQPPRRTRWLHAIPAAAALVVLLAPSAVGIFTAHLVITAIIASCAWQVWRAARPGDLRRRGLRLAALGFTAFAAINADSLIGRPAPGTLGYDAMAAFSAAMPWLMVLGFTQAMLGLLGTRSRAAWFFLVCLSLTPFGGPIIQRAVMPRIDAAARQRALRIAGETARQFDGATLSRIAAGTASSGEAVAVAEKIANLRTSSIRRDRVYFWTLRDGQFVPLPGTLSGVYREAGPIEHSAAAAGTPFLRSPLSDGWSEWLSVNAPVPATTPAVWLAIEYHSREWTRVMENTRAYLHSALVVVAIFITVAIMLAWRRALEDRRLNSLRDSETASRAKSEFLAFLSHELRTPLQSILGRSELLARTPLAFGQRHHIATIDAQGRLLLRLVGDLLDLGTIEAGKFTLQLAPFSLRRTLAACEEIARRQAGSKPLRIALEIDPKIADSLLGDETRLRQILGNLLGNAVKYTTAGEVTLSVIREVGSAASIASAELPEPAEHLAFVVRDTGSGFPPEKISQLFTLFSRLDTGGTFAREGTGVGLALVRRLCALMGGTVTAANRPTGGAEFTVRLTFPVALATDRVSSRAGLPVSVSEKRLDGSAGLHILVAEDNSAVREFLVEALGALGHTVEAVADGESALATATARRFDVALLDINLPGRDGISVAVELKKLPGAPRLIGCSAEAFAQTRDAALAAGMEAFLNKPVSLAALAAALAGGEAGDSELPPASPDHDSVFARLQSPAVAARTCALLVAEWPGCRGMAAEALASGNMIALGSLAHRLQSSALLAGDTALLARCRQLSSAAAKHDVAACRTALAEIDAMVRSLAHGE